MGGFKQLWLTPAGVVNLQNEQSRDQQFLRKITEQIRDDAIAKDAEDFAHAIALQQQTQNHLKQLEYVLARAKIAVVHHGNTIEIGSVVCFNDGVHDRTVTIVGSEEADPMKGTISSESPLGKAVLGKKVGNRVWVDSPTGRRKFVITSVA